VKWDIGSIFAHYLHKPCFPNTIRYLALLFRVNNVIHKYKKDNIVNWGKFHMFSKQTCICLTHSTRKWKRLGRPICEN